MDIEKAFKALEILKSQEIEPSAGFRRQLWQRIGNRPKQRGFWGEFAFAGLTLVIAWVVGLKGGSALYNKEQRSLQNPSEQILSEFGSTYPINSMEAWLVKTTLANPEEK